ncbi:hypothetical protein [Actinoplanes couchii]|uniref:Uncharacterized protein n=1 Tax=Actinoplanes couchii TaxID=403638 RepID=A0ABQ3XDW5_9ACTN|nr:hypothetical protein [Actinoplanes couchii]MDR6317100.1 hypothetical protein [Actinoplanes couchii]GID56595.1 hypothetical protein Aco03nite_049990 [Actinoplanes couchii]
MSYPPPSYPPPVDPFDTPPDAQPHYGQPAPSYPPPPPPPAPTLAQPTVPHQVYPQQHYPPPTPPRPRTDSRTVAITLIVAAIAATLLVGGGTAFYLAGARFGGTASPGPSPSPSPSASPGPSAVPAAEISISEPDTLNGHAKIEADELDSLTTDMEKELEGYPGAANAFGAVYGNLAQKKMIAALAAEVDIDDPQRMLDTVFQSFSGSNQLTGVTSASVGSLGGVAQCGNAKVGESDVAICGWADEGSVGMFLFFYQTAVDVKGDFPDMRAEIETKS